MVFGIFALIELACIQVKSISQCFPGNLMKIVLRANVQCESNF